MFNIEVRIWGEMSHIIIIINSVQEKISADQVNQIIMVNRKKNVFLNILDNFFELDRTYGLSLDSEGRLRSGFMESQEINVIRYL